MTEHTMKVRVVTSFTDKRKKDKIEYRGSVS